MILRLQIFWAWNFDKEEKWLNEMAAKGLCLISVGLFRYDFEDCEPGEYQIRMQLLKNVERQILVPRDCAVASK